jgi:ABC-type nickel/cobalt efflux system permease component RcnA
MNMSVLAFAFVWLLTPALADEHRQLGAHVHGHGRLNIAIEGKKVSMELEAPGADIAGFEHEASTPEQKTAIAEAKAKLANALSLFAPAPQAKCELEHVKVSIEAGHEEEHEHEHEHAQEAEEHHHSEFHAEYSLECRSLSRLTSMNFDYFNAFPAAQELDVSVIGPKGQSSFEVTREKPNLDLAGIM